MDKNLPTNDWLAQQFEENRGHLRGVAYRMLGSLAEADDAVQESWLRLTRADAAAIQNLGGWLTTVVARVCLDMLRSRGAHREESLDLREGVPGAMGGPPASVPRHLDPEQEAVLAESVGLALLVVLGKLDPAERLAFVLHDMFAVPFDEIAAIVGRSEAATRQLASRARRRVQGGSAAPAGNLAAERKVVDLFLAALRAGDFEGLLAVLDPDIVVHIEGPEGEREIHGAAAWAKGAIAFSRQFSDRARFTQPALIDGSIGLIFAPGGRLFSALRVTVADDKIIAAEIIADPAQMGSLEISTLPAAD